MRDAKAILFDFHNTLAADREPPAAVAWRVLTEAGFDRSLEAVHEALRDANRFWTGAEPVDHSAHSASRQHYVDYLRTANAGWLRQLGIEPCHPVFERWCVANDAPDRMTLFEDTLPALERLRDAGFRLGLVSNWSWDLPGILEAIGLAPFFECTVISARAGFRKPHPRIYAAALRQLSLPPASVVFVGDSPHADVLGPREAGMTPVHIDRDGVHAPLPGTLRITDLHQLVELATA